MAAFLHPGVYTIEVPSPVKVIEAAATSTAIFVGETERGPLGATKLTSRADFDRQYGGYLRTNTPEATTPPSTGAIQSPLAYAMDGFFRNGGSSCYVIRAMSNYATQATASRTIAASTADTHVPSHGTAALKVVATSPGVWANAKSAGSTTNWWGGVLAVFCPSSDSTNVQVPGGTAPANPTIERFRILVMVKSLVTGQWQIAEDWDHLSDQTTDENYVVDTLNRSLYIRWDANTAPAIPSVAQLDIHTNPLVAVGANLSALLPGGTSAVPVTGATGTALSGGVGGDNGDAPTTDYNSFLFPLADDITDAAMLVLPRMGLVDGASATTMNNVANNGIAYAENRPLRDLFYVGTLARQNSQALATNAAQAAIAEYNSLSAKSTMAGIFWPWVKVSDPVGIGKNPTTYVSPDSYVAGVFARTDGQRGVWKAPAGINASLLGVTSLEFKVKDGDQDSLNPVGINALRLQPAGGLVVWGSRTMQPSSEWRYIPVRRTAMMLRSSILNGIQFAVFEPNDESLWSALRATVGGFMDRLFRQGAFAGSTASSAYFVKCDASTTSSADQAAGVVNVLVGFAPLRPAEFVIVKLSQFVSQTS